MFGQALVDFGDQLHLAALQDPEIVRRKTPCAAVFIRLKSDATNQAAVARQKVMVTVISVLSFVLAGLTLGEMTFDDEGARRTAP